MPLPVAVPVHRTVIHRHKKMVNPETKREARLASSNVTITIQSGSQGPFKKEGRRLFQNYSLFAQIQNVQSDY
jgi:hypothetical protein